MRIEILDLCEENLQLYDESVLEMLEGSQIYSDANTWKIRDVVGIVDDCDIRDNIIEIEAFIIDDDSSKKISSGMVDVAPSVTINHRKEIIDFVSVHLVPEVL